MTNQDDRRWKLFTSLIHSYHLAFIYLTCFVLYRIMLDKLEKSKTQATEEEEDEQIIQIARYKLLSKTVEEECPPKKKQKTEKLKDDEIVILKEFFKTVVDSIKESTAELVKSHQRLQIPASEIWAYLEELQLEKEVHYAAYLYLIKNPAELGAFLGCPSQSRKTILLTMLHNAKTA